MCDPVRKIDFIGIGSVKSGTTWIARCLEQHPDILFSSQKTGKELHFFDSDQDVVHHSSSNFSKGLDWYLDQFPEAQEDKVRGEYCNSYLVDKLAYRRINKFLPEVKLLVSLRDPVEMIYSLYWWWRAAVTRKMPPSFVQALEETDLLKVGLYGQHLQKFYDVFSSEAILVVLFEDIKSRPDSVAADIYRFLGVDESFLPSGLQEKANPAIRQRIPWLQRFARRSLGLLRDFGGTKLYDRLMEGGLTFSLYRKFNVVSFHYPPLDSDLRERLKEYFRPDVQRLEDLVGMDLLEKWGFENG